MCNLHDGTRSWCVVNKELESWSGITQKRNPIMVPTQMPRANRRICCVEFERLLLRTKLQTHFSVSFLIIHVCCTRVLLSVVDSNDLWILVDLPRKTLRDVRKFALKFRNVSQILSYYHTAT